MKTPEDPYFRHCFTVETLSGGLEFASRPTVVETNEETPRKDYVASRTLRKIVKNGALSNVLEVLVMGGGPILSQ